MSPANSSPEDDDRYHVPSLVRALQILELLAKEPGVLGISEMASRLGLPKNSVFRITTTLVDHGYLHRDPVQKVFTLSHKLLALGYAAIDEANLVEKALKSMHQLCELTQETVLLGVLSGRHGIVVEQIPSPSAIKVMVEIGHQFPLHSSAPGKIFLAYMDQERRDSILDQMTFTRFTDRTITDRSAYLLELARVRETGYALDQGEEVDGIHCIAAPIRNRRGQAIASIWVTGPSTRLRKSSFEKVRRLVMEQARQISLQIGWTNNIQEMSTPQSR